MIAEISGGAFDAFFAWAPWVIGLLIYLAFYVAKRHESATKPAPVGQTYACAGCGRRGPREHMVPQQHGGAVGWYCADCASFDSASLHSG
ncbi:MAG: hypothetical protein JO003_11775 [Candidatus Eremiobacteraeota bacterium]|nr:hypothetical protein [Candidatus Eremiobacteraeota bacterium]